MQRVKGLDSLRFLMAVIVLVGHGALPEFENKIINGIIGNSFVGVAAVMVFFILSGFVIHYPYSSGVRKINVFEFYLKRLSRIVIPALVAIIIYHYTLDLYMGVIWSLVCEVIYYILYPLILKFIKKIDFILLSTFAFSYGSTIVYSLLSESYNGDFHRTGYFLTWIAGFPMWLLGVKLCILFVKLKTQKLSISFSRIILFRISVLILSGVTSVLRFHFNIAYGYTLPIFSLFAFIWLKNELIFNLNKEENKVLAYGGIFSYSIYLMHYFIMYLFLYVFNIEIHNIVYSAILILFTLFGSWIFYILIEKPSHKFSRAIKLSN